MRRYRRREKEQRYAILEYAVCMTTLRIVKTTLMEHHIDGWEYAVCMTTLRTIKIVKTIFVHVAFINKNERQMC